MPLGVQFWHIAAVATTVMWTAYTGIGVVMVSGMLRNRQWATNHLGVATAAIFLTCAASHGMHVMHSLLPAVGTDAVLGTAARGAFGDPRLVAVNLAAAAIAIWYVSLRNRFKVVWRGAALFDDMRERQDRALEIHDNVVQDVTRAKLELDRGNREAALEIIEETLADSKALTTQILGEEGSDIGLGAGEIHRPEEVDDA